MEKGLTLSELLKKIFFNKKLFIISFLSIFSFILLYIELGYNKNNQNYKVEFEYIIPEMVEGRYPDGSLFDYRSLTTLDSLISVKESNDKYNDIDVLSLYDSNEISISNEDNIYELIINAKFFDSLKIAKSFIYDLINLPIKKINDNIKKDNIVFLALFDEANNYQLQITYLEKQYSLIIDKINKLIADYGNIKSVDDLKRQIEFYFSINSFQNLKNELELYGYIKDSIQYENDLKNQKAILNNKRVILINKRDKIEAYLEDLASKGFVNTNVEGYTNEIALLSNQIVDIDESIRSIDRQLSSQLDTSSFDQKLIVYKNKLLDFTKMVQDVELNLFNSVNHLYINDGLSLNGGINIIVGILLSIVLSFMISSVISLILGKKNYEK